MNLIGNLIFLFIAITCFGLLKCRDKPPYRPAVEISTDYGNIEMEIFIDQAPVTANNFLEYIKRGMYNHACFYRVVARDNQPENQIKIEVIQGGLGFEDSLPKIG